MIADGKTEGGARVRAALGRWARPKAPGAVVRVSATAVEYGGDGRTVTAEAVLDGLKRAGERQEFAPFAQILLLPIAVVASGAVLFTRAPGPAVALFVVIGVALTVATYVVIKAHDTERCSFHLHYELDDVTARRFSDLQHGFFVFASCGAVWHLATSRAGADAGMPRQADGTRYRVHPIFSAPPRVRCNIQVATLQAGSKTLYLFPDRMLVYGRAGVSAIEYDEVAIETSKREFVETSEPPNDATIVGTTWRYVDRDGGPDPRHRNNYRIPIALYGEVRLLAPSHLDARYQSSRPDGPLELARAFSAYVGREEPEAPGPDPEPETTESSAPAGSSDPLADEVLITAVREGFASAHMIAQQLNLELTRAAAILDDLADDGFLERNDRGLPRIVRNSARRYVDMLLRATRRRTEQDAGRASGRGHDAGSGRKRSRPARRGSSRPAHEVLGVRLDATSEEIAGAYRNLANLYHPDRVAGLGPELQDLAETRMKEINAAYRELRGRS